MSKEWGQLHLCVEVRILDVLGQAAESGVLRSDGEDRHERLHFNERLQHQGQLGQAEQQEVPVLCGDLHFA